MKLIAVKNIEQLRSLMDSEVFEYRIALNGGAYSRKICRPRYDGEIEVENLIDGTVTSLADTNIYEAMKKGAFFAEIDTDEQ